MGLAASGSFNSVIKQVGKLTGPSEIGNGASFRREDGDLVSVGMGNRVILYISTLFTDQTIFSDPNFTFMGIQLGWAITNVNPETGANFSARTFEKNAQVVGGINPFNRSLYIEPAITLSANPSFADTQMAKMNWQQWEIPYDNPNRSPSGPPSGYGVGGIALPLIARGDYMAAWIRLMAGAGWPGFSNDDVIQIDLAVGANAQ
jgi:hypothetical protein